MSSTSRTYIALYGVLTTGLLGADPGPTVEYPFAGLRHTIDISSKRS